MLLSHVPAAARRSSDAAISWRAISELGGMGRNDRMKMARIGSWSVGAATNCTPNRCVASPEDGQQQQHQADETEDMNEVAHPV
jgi:hypothetical protein